TGVQTCALPIYAVVGKQQKALAPTLFPMAADTVGQRLEIQGVQVIAFDKTDFRDVAQRGGSLVEGIPNRRGGGGGVLGIQGQNQNSLNPFRLESVQGRGDGRVAIGHGVFNPDLIAKVCLQALGQAMVLLLGNDLDRGAAFEPDLLVFGNQPLGAERQNNQIQNQPPDQARGGRHAAVVVELLEVAADRLALRCVGCAKVDQ